MRYMRCAFTCVFKLTHTHTHTHTHAHARTHKDELEHKYVINPIDSEQPQIMLT